MDRNRIVLTVADVLKNNPVYVPVEYMPDEFLEAVNAWCGENYESVVADLSMYQVLDYLFDSDEEVTAIIYAYKGIPFMLYEKYGDRNGSNNTVLNRVVWREFLGAILDISMNGSGDIPAMEDITIGDENGYIAFSRDANEENFGVSVYSPKWQCGFGQMFKDHRAEIEGERIGSFVRFVNNKRSWEKEGNSVVVIMEDGTECTVDGCDIVFIREV